MVPLLPYAQTLGSPQEQKNLDLSRGGNLVLHDVPSEYRRVEPTPVFRLFDLCHHVAGGKDSSGKTPDLVHSINTQEVQQYRRVGDSIF